MMALHWQLLTYTYSNQSVRVIDDASKTLNLSYFRTTRVNLNL